MIIGVERGATVNKDPTFIMYYVTKTELKIVDGKLEATETILTKPSEQATAREGAARFRALGVQNVHVVKHVAKRFKKLMREQNKRRKENPLTVADIAEMAKQAQDEICKDYEGE